MSEKIAKAINGITTALVAVVAALAIALVAGKPFGIHAYAVLSGSMEPAYSTGDLIYVKETDASKLGPGDAITFMTGKDSTVTHRIVAEVQGEDGVTRFQTQGDANDTPDGDLVHPDNVIGEPVFAIPMLGYLVNFVQFPPGTYLALSFCAVIVFLMFLPDLLPSKEDAEGEEGETEEAPAGRHAKGGREPAGRAGAGAHAQLGGRPAYAYGPPPDAVGASSSLQVVGHPAGLQLHAGAANAAGGPGSTNVSGSSRRPSQPSPAAARGGGSAPARMPAQQPRTAQPVPSGANNPRLTRVNPGQVQRAFEGSSQPQGARRHQVAAHSAASPVASTVAQARQVQAQPGPSRPVANPVACPTNNPNASGVARTPAHPASQSSTCAPAAHSAYRRPMQ